MRPVVILVSTLALAACNFSAGAQENGSGRNESRSFDVAAFEGVTLAGSHDVVVTTGAAPSVRAEGDSAVIDKLDIRVEGGTLRIGTKKGVRFNLIGNRRPVTIYVTAPTLKSASVAGSGDMKIDKIEGESFAGAIAGSGDLDIASVRVGSASFSVAGSGDIRARGAASSVKSSIAGSGDIDLSDLQSKQASVSIVGSGDIRAQASETADVNIMGSGNVTMAGGARCTVNKRGSGEVDCG